MADSEKYIGTPNGIVLCVDNDYRKQIMEYIKSNNIDVKVVR